jgi:hypothetical protein
VTSPSTTLRTTILHSANGSSRFNESCAMGFLSVGNKQASPVPDNCPFRICSHALSVMSCKLAVVEVI